MTLTLVPFSLSLWERGKKPAQGSSKGKIREGVKLRRMVLSVCGMIPGIEFCICNRSYSLTSPSPLFSPPRIKVRGHTRAIAPLLTQNSIVEVCASGNRGKSVALRVSFRG